MPSASEPPSIDEVIARIHGEIERRRAPAAATGPTAASVGEPASDSPLARPPFRLQPEFAPRPDGRYELHELLDYHDVAFVTNAYRAILGRWPDPVGLRHYSELLRNGGASKVDILGRLRFSREGRRRQVRVQGLLPRFALARGFRLPMIGWLLQWPLLLLGLPRLAANQRRFEAYTLSLQESLAAELQRSDELHRAREAALVRLEGALVGERSAREELGGRLGARADGIEEALAGGRRDLESALGQLDGLAGALAGERRGREELGGQLFARAERIEQGLVAERGAREALGGMLAAARDAMQTELDRLDAGLALQNRLARDLGRDLLGLRHALDEIRGVSDLVGRVADQVRGEVAAREALGGLVAARVADTEQRLLGQIRGLAEMAGRLDHEVRGEVAVREVLGGRVAGTDLALARLRREMVQQARRLDLLLEEARRRMPEPLGEKGLGVFADEARHRLDALYGTLEDELRGPRDDVKARLLPYLDVVKGAGAGSEAWPVLDLGSGRGEWLELLREHGLAGRGVDLNRIYVADCQEAGLDVAEGDLLEHLRKLPSGILGAVTGFQIVEHLPLDVLVDTLSEVARVLRPGGVAVFETPNPANVLVGSHTFYYDPTHHNPLPAALMRLLLESCGLCGIEVLELNPNPELPPLPGDDELTGRINAWFCGPRDYAVVGRRA